MSPSLEPGRTLGHFRIVAPLGAGGMGEVYKAWDGELERHVALKVLPPERGGDADRLRRFAQEAKAASALGHPNIVTVYQVGQAHDDRTGAPVHYIAMELVEGRTLRELLDDERVGPRALLGYLAQAAAGVARAHEAGVVHRDLKPENVMVGRDGFVKVLDFGLAKLDPPPGGDSVAESAVAPTAEGTLLGTVGYLSPEQALGRAVDHRSDVFSFGCMLYEAATRRRAFAGDSAIDVLHAILHSQPPPVEEVAPATPPALARLVARCLAKEPAQRFQSMRDLAVAVEDVAADLAAPAPPSGAPPSAVAGLPEGGRRRMAGGRRVALAVAAAALAAVALWWVRSRPTDEPTREAGFQTMSIEPLTSDGTVVHATLAPDGRYLAYVRAEGGEVGLWLRQLATGSDVAVVPPGPLPIAAASFTPDGEHVYFLREDPQLPNYRIAYRVPTLGGEPRPVARDVDAAVAFSPDGRRMAFPRSLPHERRSVLVVAAADGSDARELASLPEPDRFLFTRAAWSPDGERLVAAVARGGELRPLELVVFDPATGAPSPLPGDPGFIGLAGITWLPDGSGLVVAGRRAAADGDQLWLVEQPGGRLVRISNDLHDYGSVSVSADGATLAAVLTARVTHLHALPLQRPRDDRQLTRGTREAVAAIAAAPGGEVYFLRRTAARSPGEAGAQLWKTDVDGEPRLLAAGAGVFSPRVSADGRVLVAGRATDGAQHVWRLDPASGAPLAQLTRGAGTTDFDLSPDGTWLAYATLDRRELLRAPLDGGPPTTLATSVRRAPRISPDGTLVAYAAFDDVGGEARATIHVVDASGSPRRSLPWDLGAYDWHPDGDALVEVRRRGGAETLFRVPLDGGEPTALTSFPGGFFAAVDASPDGEWIFVIRGAASSDAVRIRGFR